MENLKLNFIIISKNRPKVIYMTKNIHKKKINITCRINFNSRKIG